MTKREADRLNASSRTYRRRNRSHRELVTASCLVLREAIFKRFYERCPEYILRKDRCKEGKDD